jgi:ATP-dependent RNA helicase DDX49/DBP8
MAKSKRVSEATAKEDQGGMTLNPMEVMKAMLAQKGKGKQLESASEDEDEDEDEDESEGDDQSEDESESAGSDNGKDREEDTGSQAESSRSAELRNAQQQPSPISRIPTSRVTTKPKSEPFQSTKPPSDTTFESLGLSKPLISALASINIKKPTEIQSACLGPIMAGRDCIGGAKTGSGKTLAFALPIVERIARDPFGVWAVVLTPTR